MPWPDRERKAIAAKMVREGKTSEEISRFFREHGHVGEKRKGGDRRAGSDRRGRGRGR